VPSDHIDSLLGISTYTKPTKDLLDLYSTAVERIRVALGGNIAPLPITKLRWYQKDLERAVQRADTGDMSFMSQLWQACQGDGTIKGLLNTRTDGLVRLPKIYKGDDNIISLLKSGSDSVRSVFDEMHPPSELSKLANDGIGLGVFIGERVPVRGRDYPVLVRLDPQFLLYRWSDNQWFYRSVAGLIAIVPGDGRWVLGTPGGRLTPWQGGSVRPVGGAWIDKSHAKMHVANWEAKLANPARVAIAPHGAGEEQQQSWFQAVMSWGINTTFGLKPGYDVKLLESNGRGYESFGKTIERAEREIILTLSGQEVTTDGGAGFLNADMFRQIQVDLIKATADALSYTINTQSLPPWIEQKFGVGSLNPGVAFEWDVKPPADKASIANTYIALANAINQLKMALDSEDLKPDVKALLNDFNVPYEIKTEIMRAHELELSPETQDETRPAQEQNEDENL